MFSRRYSGRWSSYLLTIRWASSPGPAKPLAIGIAGLAAAITTAAGCPVAGLSDGGASCSAGCCCGNEGSLGVVMSSCPWVTVLAAGEDGGGSLAGIEGGTTLIGGPGGKACCRVLLQHGQAYLWTWCSITNSDAGL